MQTWRYFVAAAPGSFFFCFSCVHSPTVHITVDITVGSLRSCSLALFRSLSFAFEVRSVTDFLFLGESFCWTCTRLYTRYLFCIAGSVLLDVR